MLNHRPTSFITFLIITFLFVSNCYAAAEEDKAPLELLHSDHLEIKNYEDNTIVNLIGNVQFRQGKTEISSQRAVWYKSAGQVVLVDSVFMDDGEGGTVSTDRATYFRKNKKIIARGNVVATTDSGRVILTGDRGDYLREQEYLLMKDNPQLKARDEGDTSWVVIDALKLEYFGDADIGIATDSVKITKGDMVATAGKAYFYREEEYVRLEETPIATIEESCLEGDTILVYTAKDEVSHIRVIGSAEAEYEPSPDSLGRKGSVSILTGEWIDFYLTDEKPDSVLVVERATSFYKPAESDTTSGINEASGDTIRFYIEDKELSRALILGGARGNYRFRPEDAPPDSVVEDTVRYFSNDIDYAADDSSIILIGNSRVIYQTMNLEAHRIVFVTSQDYVYAEGDSIREGDSTYYKGPPILQENEDRIIGYKMEYNIANKKGRITYGDTQFEGGFYGGEDLRKVSDEVLYVKDGIYTSCNLMEPHYGFYCKKMKLIARDKVIAKPVIMYIGDLPVAALPFYVFPIKKGRHSGFTTFEIGNFERGERFIRNVGYYWAASEYWDVEGTFDYFEDSHIALNLTGRYALRYKLSGRVNTSLVNESRFAGMSRIKRQRWRLNFGHNQTINETTSLTASGTFMSDKSFTDDISYDPEEIRNRQLSSHASLSKRFEDASLTITVNQNWNLDTDIRTEQLPTIRYSRRNQALFPYEEPKKNVEKPKKWYHNIYYSYSADAKNYRQINRFEGSDAWKEYMTANHNFSLSAPVTVGGVLTLTPRGSFQESWYYIPATAAAGEAGLETKTFKRRATYDLGASATTNLYGMFALNTGIVEAIRHVVTPTVAYSWKPEFNKDVEYYDFTGVGGAGTRVNSMSFGLNNLFQMKGMVRGKEYKLDLVSVNMSTGYNFLSEDRRWSNLNTSFSSNSLVRNFSLSGSMQHSFYSEDPTDVSPDFLHPRLMNYSLSLSTSFSGSSGEQSIIPEFAEEVEEEDTGYFGRRRRPEIPTQAPWSVSINARYSESRFGESKSITRWLNISYQTPVTPGWRVKWNCRYDVDKNRISSQEFQISRNLHCWEGSFIWIPQGVRSGYYLKVNVIELPEVKVETSEGGIRGGGYY